MVQAEAAAAGLSDLQAALADAQYKLQLQKQIHDQEIETLVSNSNRTNHSHTMVICAILHARSQAKKIVYIPLTRAGHQCSCTTECTAGSRAELYFNIDKQRSVAQSRAMADVMKAMVDPT